MPLSRLATALAFLLTALTVSSISATTLQLLRNGGFEQGTSGWSGAGLSSSGCAPHSGAGALAIVSGGSIAFAQQNIRGPLGEGSYSLSGSLMIGSGAPQIEVILTWLDAAGSELDRESRGVGVGASYGSFSLHSSLPAGADSLRVRVSVDATEATTVCLDDLSLEGPPPPQPTSTPAATPSPSATPTNTPASTATTEPTSTPKPTSTPRPTATAKPAASTPVAEARATDPTASPTATTQPDIASEGNDPDSAPSLTSPRAAAATESTEEPTPVALSPEPKPQPSPIAEVRAVFASGAPGEEPPPSLTQASSGDSGVPDAWLAAMALFVAALGSSYAFQRRRA